MKLTNQDEKMLRLTMTAALLSTAFSTIPTLGANTSATGTPAAMPLAKVNPSTWFTQEQPGVWRATKLVGLNIYNSGNEKIGEINEVLIDSSGTVKAVVIGAGGFLGMGEHSVAVPFSDLQFVDRERRVLARNPAMGGPELDANGHPVTSTAAPNNTTETLATNSEAANAQATRAEQYPELGMLNMTKDELKAAPEFKYAR